MDFTTKFQNPLRIDGTEGFIEYNDSDIVNLLARQLVQLKVRMDELRLDRFDSDEHTDIINVFADGLKSIGVAGQIISSATEPSDTANDLKGGDIWYQPSTSSNTWSIHFWTGSKWEAFGQPRGDDPPQTPEAGDLWYDSLLGVLRMYNANDKWEAISTKRNAAANIFTGTSPNGLTNVDIIEGDVWWDSHAETLRVWDGNTWKSAGGAEIKANAPSPAADGNLWYNEANKTLYVYSEDVDLNGDGDTTDTDEAGAWYAVSVTRAASQFSTVPGTVGPQSVMKGDKYYNTTENKLYVWNGSEWTGAGGNFDTIGFDGAVVTNDPAYQGASTGETLRGFIANGVTTGAEGGGFYGTSTGVTIVGPTNTAGNNPNTAQLSIDTANNANSNIAYRVNATGTDWSAWKELATEAYVDEIAENLAVTGTPFPWPVPYDVTSYINGRVPSSIAIVGFIAAHSFTIGAGFSGCFCFCHTGSNNETVVFTITRRGADNQNVQLGTITFEPGSRNGVFAQTAEIGQNIIIGAGEVLTVTAPVAAANNAQDAEGIPLVGVGNGAQSDQGFLTPTITLTGTMNALQGRTYDVANFLGGVVSGTDLEGDGTQQLLMASPTVRPYTVVAGAQQSQARCFTAPNQQIVLNIRRGWPVGAVVGTITFAANSNTGVFATSNNETVQFSSADMLSITGPSNLQGMTDLGITIAGTLNN